MPTKAVNASSEIKSVLKGSNASPKASTTQPATAMFLSWQCFNTRRNTPPCIKAPTSPMKAKI